MDRMKSAFERAMERVEDLGEATPEEKLQLTWVPHGQRMAADYLRGQQDLKAALEKCSPQARPYAVKGMTEVLIQSIQLPRAEADQKRIEHALEGIRLLKKDGKAVNEIAERINYICNTFGLYKKEQLDKIYPEFKAEFQQRVQEALQKQGTIAPNTQINVESMPEFHQEWARVVSQFDAQYQGPLEEQKALLEKVP